MKRVTTATPPLTADQFRVAHLFGKMSEEAQAGMLAMMGDMAEICPRRARPVLRIVGGSK